MQHLVEPPAPLMVRPPINYTLGGRNKYHPYEFNELSRRYNVAAKQHAADTEEWEKQQLAEELQLHAETAAWGEERQQMEDLQQQNPPPSTPGVAALPADFYPISSDTKEENTAEE